MRIKSLFSKMDSPAYEARDVLVGDETVTVQVPSTFAALASDILVRKYFRHRGVPSQVEAVAEEGVPVSLSRSEPAEGSTSGRETDARQAFGRIAGAWAYHGVKQGLFVDVAQAELFRNEVVSLFEHQIAAPNSPQWFSTGLHWAYGLSADGRGHYRFDPASDGVIEVEDVYAHPQPHA